MTTPVKLNKFIIELDELILPTSGRHLRFKDLTQFLIEAELAEQPVFRYKDGLYFFIEHDIALISVSETDKKEIEDWNIRRTTQGNKMLEMAKNLRKLNKKK